MTDWVILSGDGINPERITVEFVLLQVPSDEMPDFGMLEAAGLEERHRYPGHPWNGCCFVRLDELKNPYVIRKLRDGAGQRFLWRDVVTAYRSDTMRGATMNAWILKQEPVFQRDVLVVSDFVRRASQGWTYWVLRTSRDGHQFTYFPRPDDKQCCRKPTGEECYSLGFQDKGKVPSCYACDSSVERLLFSFELMEALPSSGALCAWTLRIAMHPSQALKDPTTGTLYPRLDTDYALVALNPTTTAECKMSASVVASNPSWFQSHETADDGLIWIAEAVLSFLIKGWLLLWQKECSKKQGAESTEPDDAATKGLGNEESVLSCIPCGKKREYAKLWREGKSRDEIAQILGVEPTSVTKRVYELRKEYGKNVIPYRH